MTANARRNVDRRQGTRIPRHRIPDHSTKEGQRLATQLDALPPAVSAGDAETVLGLPGRMPLTHTRPDGTHVRRQGQLLDGRMYLAWEHGIDIAPEASVWERVDPVWWRAQRHEMALDRLVERLRGTVSTHVNYRHADPLLDELLTLAWEVAQHSRDHDLLTQVQEAMDRAREPIQELFIRDRIARGFIRHRIALGADTDPHRDLDPIITQVRALHVELLTGALTARSEIR